MRHIVSLFVKRVLMYGAVFAIVTGVVVAVALRALPTLHVDKSHTESSSEVELTKPDRITTSTWALFDPQSGRIYLSSGDVHAPHPIASIAKLFIADAVMKSTRKDETFTITESDVDSYGRAGKLAVGDTVTPHALLFPLLIESSNDAAHALERFLGTEPQRLLKERVAQLGLSETVIEDASGLSAHDRSSISDLIKFYTYLVRSEPHLFDITQLNLYVGEHAGYMNNNPGRTFDSFVGGKHGYTPEAGGTFIGTFTSQNGDFGVVLLNSSDLITDIGKLIDCGTDIVKSSAIMVR